MIKEFLADIPDDTEVMTGIYYYESTEGIQNIDADKNALCKDEDLGTQSYNKHDNLTYLWYNNGKLFLDSFDMGSIEYFSRRLKK